MPETRELSERLLEAWSEANLNKIARNLIRLYKEKEFEKLNIISGMISEWVKIEIDQEGKGFSKIISLYHPDRGDYYRNQILELTEKSDSTLLARFEHIFVVQDIEEIAANIESYEDIDYHPEYMWDVKDTGFSYFQDKKKKARNGTRKTRMGGCSFYEAMQIRQYGDTDTSFPTYYLEDMDEVELSESEIDDLDGAEYCIHTISMDLSGNRIADLEPLAGLHRIQELNLANNRLSYIDALSNLQQLKSLDLSNNSIDDISPLFEIETLEYLDLTGNKISPGQLAALREMGVIVDYE
jgi:Leucine-rich repeat (LRR) protein